MIVTDTQSQNNCLLTKFSLLSPPPPPALVQRVHHIKILDQIHVSFYQEVICLLLNWSFGLLLIGPLIYPHLILQNVNDFRKTGRLVFCPPGSQVRSSTVKSCRTNL